MNKVEQFSIIWERIERGLKPPVFPGDEDKTRQARVFHTFVTGVAIILAFAAVVVVCFARQKTGGMIFVLLAGGVTLLMDRTMRQGRIRLAAGWFVTIAWVLAAIFVVESGGLGSTASSLFIPVMAMAALFLGWQASVASAGFSLIFLLGIAVLEESGYDLPRWFLTSSMAAWTMFAISCVLALIPLISMQRELLIALGQAREQLLKREKTEAALRLSEANYHLISSLTFDYTYSVHFNAEGSPEPLRVRGAFETITGYSLEEFSARGGWRAVVHPDDLAQDDRDMANLRENRRILSELRIVRKDGGIRWVRTFADPVWDEEHQRLAGINGAVQDITASRLAEQALRENEAKFRTIFELAPYGITIQQQDGKFLAANQAFLNRFGLSAEQLEGKSPFELEIFSDPQAAQQLMRELSVNGRFLNREIVMNRRGEGPISMLISSQRIELAGETIVLTVGVDITERKQAEQALGESEKRYRAISSLISDYAYAHDIGPDGSLAPAWMTDESFTRLTGYRFEEIGSTYNLYHPDDAPLAERDIEQSIRGQATSRDYRIITKTGELRWIHIDRQVEWDVQHQRPIRLYGAAKDITERQQVAEALRESEQKFRMFIEQSTEGMLLTDEQGRIIEWNQAQETLTGIPRREALDLYIWEVQVRLAHPNKRIPGYAERIQKIVTDALHTGQSHFFAQVTEAHFFPPGHPSRYVQQYMFPIKTETGFRIGALLRDITERRRAEQQLQEERALLRDLIDHLPDLVFVKDLEGCFRISNTAHTRAVGCSQEEEVLGKTVRDFYAQELADAYTRDDQGVFATHETLLNREEPAMNAAGQLRWMLTTKIPLYDHLGQVTGLIGISRDITERREAEALLREREEALRQLNAQLEQRVIERTARLEAANRELETFAYSVSHDLRAPLRSIDGFGQALLDDYNAVLDGEGQDYLRRIRAATQRMGGMIDALLSLSRITRSELKAQPLNLSHIAAEVVAQLAEADPSRQVEVVIQPDLQAVGDARLLRIALQNLLENAWKYTRPQPHPRLELSAQQQANGPMVYCVSDNGIGFDMIYSDKVFGAFQRLHPQNEFPGHGIGLATVQRIIHRHGGTIWARSQAGQGAAFYFTLEATSR